MTDRHCLARLVSCAAALLLVAAPARPADPPATKIDLDELVPHPDLAWLRRAKVPTDDAGRRGPEPDPAVVERRAGRHQTRSEAPDRG